MNTEKLETNPKLEYDLDAVKTHISVDAKGQRHIWGVSKCKLLANKNEYGHKLFDVEVGEEGRLVTYKNPNNGNTSWEVIFKRDKFSIKDGSVFERYIKKI